MKLSIGMMVKNEEKYLEQCLSSLMPILEKVDSELIIVDTGSNDKTVEIAKKFTDKIYFHEWNNDFAEMRNITISYCKGEWFFCIDGDEIIEDCSEIIDFFNTEKYKNFQSVIVNVKNLVDLNDLNNYILYTGLRFFKNDKDFKYIGNIHNQPIFKEPTARLSTNIIHYGYILTDKELMDKKFKRTAIVLQNELKKDPDNIYYIYQLSVSYSMHGDKDKAVNEINKAYNVVKDKKNNISEHLYILQQLCVCSLATHNYQKLEEYSSEWLLYKDNVVDVHYYLGFARMMLAKDNESLKSFKKYIDLIISGKGYDTDIKNISYTMGRLNDVYYYISALYSKIGDNYKVIEYLIKMKSDKSGLIQEVVDFCIKNKYYEGLYYYYLNLTSENNINSLFDLIEKEKTRLSDNDCIKVTKLFSGEKNAYGKLNRIRITYIETNNINAEEIKGFISELGIGNLPVYFGDLFYYLLGLKENISELLFNINDKSRNDFIKYIYNKYEDFVHKVNDYMQEYCCNEDIMSLIINKELCKYAVQANGLSNDDFEFIFLKYIDIGIKYVNLIYTPYVIWNEIAQIGRDNEEVFFIHMSSISKKVKLDKKNILDNIEKIEGKCKSIECGIRTLKANQRNSEFEVYKAQVKNTIKLLIDSGRTEDAKKIITEYEEIVKDDLEVYSFKAAIFILNGQVDIAESILKEGLKCNDRDFELNYNMAEIHFAKVNYKVALKYYVKAFYYIDNVNTKNHIKSIISEVFTKLNINKNVDEYIEKQREKKVLVLCHFYSVFTKEFLENMKKNYSTNFDILTLDSSYNENVSTGTINKVYLYNDLQDLQCILEQIEQYDIIHIHYLTPFYGVIADKIRSKCKKLLVSIWGGDFYDVSVEQRLSQNKILDVSDIITFGNEDVVKSFNKYYYSKYIEKINICRFGLKNLEKLEKISEDDISEIKKELGIPSDSVIVTVGYSAYLAQNHIAVMESINKVKERLPENTFFIFPMTYGDPGNVITSLKEYMRNSSFDYKIFEEFLSDENVSKIRIITDIMIQVQPTDQLSGSMQEHLYSNGVIITGDWLPYDILKRYGAKYLEVSNINEVGKEVKYSIDNLKLLKEKFKCNREAIYKLSSWKNTITQWINVYDMDK